MLKKRTKLINEKAKELLFAGENYITLLLATVIFALALILPLIAYYLAYGCVKEDYLILAFLIIEFFVSWPLFFGMLRIAGLAARKADMSVLDIFYAFVSPKKYFMAVALVFIRIFKHLTPISIGCILAHLAIYFLRIPSDIAVLVVIAFAIASYALLLPLVVRLYAVDLLVASDDIGILKAIRLSWDYTRKARRFLIVFSIKSIPLFIASVAAILVPLVIYTMPFLLCAYAVICRRLINIQTQKQNDICSADIPADVEEINEQDS